MFFFNPHGLSKSLCLLFSYFSLELSVPVTSIFVMSDSYSNLSNISAYICAKDLKFSPDPEFTKVKIRNFYQIDLKLV